MTEWFNKSLGRWLVRLPDGRETYRYRALVEQELGRVLSADEHVHHLNGDRTDDRLENLVVLSASAHARLHTPDRTVGHRLARGDAWGPGGVDGCIECGTDERPHTALGLCERCYSRLRARRVRGSEPRQPATVIAYVCEGCGETFERSLHEQRDARFCSKACASRASATKRWAARRDGAVGTIGRRA